MELVVGGMLLYVLVGYCFYQLFMWMEFPEYVAFFEGEKVEDAEKILNVLAAIWPVTFAVMAYF